MSTPVPANLYTQGFGSRPENVEIPTYQPRPPASTDVHWPQGKRWIDTVADAEYSLTSFSSALGVVSATWVALGGGSSALATLSGDTGVAVPVGGDIEIAGTSPQIVTSASGSTVTISAGTGGFPITPYVVGPSGEAGYQTVQSAITAANAAGGGLVFIQNGTYTENLTLFSNVFLLGD